MKWMRREKKIEVIEFAQFMKKYTPEKKKKIALPVYSFGFTWEGFMHMSPEMAGAYIGLTTIGGIAIVGTLAINWFLSQNESETAEKIANCISILFPATMLVMLVMFVGRLFG